MNEKTTTNVTEKDSFEESVYARFDAMEIIYLTHEARGAGGSIKPGVKSRFIGTEPQDHVRND